MAQKWGASGCHQTVHTGHSHFAVQLQGPLVSRCFEAKAVAVLQVLHKFFGEASAFCAGEPIWGWFFKPQIETALASRRSASSPHETEGLDS